MKFSDAQNRPDSDWVKDIHRANALDENQLSIHREALCLVHSL